MNAETNSGDGINDRPTPIRSTSVILQENQIETSGRQESSNEINLNQQITNINNNSNIQPSSSGSMSGEQQQNMDNIRRREISNSLNIPNFISGARNAWAIQNVFQGPFVRNTYVNNLRTWMPISSTFRNIPSINNNNNNINNNNDVSNGNLSRTTHSSSPARISSGLVQNNDPNNPQRNNVINMPESIVPQISSSSLNERILGTQNPGEPNENDPQDVADLLTQVPEAQQAINTMIRYIPILCIILVKLVYDNIRDIIDLFIMITFFLHFNSTLRDQVAKQSNRDMVILFREAIYVVVYLGARFLFIDYLQFYSLLLYRPNLSLIYGNPITLMQLLYAVIIADFLTKIITVGVKNLVAMLPQQCIKFKRRGRFYLLLEAISQFYRSLLPIQPWTMFLLFCYDGWEKVVGIVLLAAYTIEKLYDIYKRSKFFHKSFKLFLKQVNYGRSPTSEELAAIGGLCPICHETFNTPIVLNCGHIFCELCVGTWFTRERTCPLCRAAVADDPTWQDGATSFFIQIF